MAETVAKDVGDVLKWVRNYDTEPTLSMAILARLGMNSKRDPVTYGAALTRLEKEGAMSFSFGGNYRACSSLNPGYQLNPVLNGKPLFFSAHEDCTHYAHALRVPNVEMGPGGFQFENPLSTSQWASIYYKFCKQEGNSLPLEELVNGGILTPERPSHFGLIRVGENPTNRRINLIANNVSYAITTLEHAKWLSVALPFKTQVIKFYAGGETFDIVR